MNDHVGERSSHEALLAELRALRRVREAAHRLLSCDGGPGELAWDAMAHGRARRDLLAALAAARAGEVGGG